jgi:hypothetical protein
MFFTASRIHGMQQEENNERKPIRKRRRRIQRPS